MPLSGESVLGCIGFKANITSVIQLFPSLPDPFEQLDSKKDDDAETETGQQIS
jgi:hypothetical protein